MRLNSRLVDYVVCVTLFGLAIGMGRFFAHEPVVNTDLPGVFMVEPGE